MDKEQKYIDFLIYVQNYKFKFTPEELDEIHFIRENFFISDENVMTERLNNFYKIVKNNLLNPSVI